MSTLTQLRILCVLAELSAAWLTFSTIKRGEISINGLFELRKVDRPVFFYSVCLIGFLLITAGIYSVFL